MEQQDQSRSLSASAVAAAAGANDKQCSRARAMMGLLNYLSDEARLIGSLASASHIELAIAELSRTYGFADDGPFELARLRSLA